MSEADTLARAAQREAIAHVRATAIERVTEARATAERLMRAAGEGPDALDALLDRIRAHGRVTLNFHPDRSIADGRSSARALLDEGIYRSQFETRISNGSLTAFEGGPRDEWERELFGGAYHQPGVGPADRPKYGGFDVLDHADGAAPRFGSCHFRLRGDVTARSTFTFGDSHLSPAHRAPLDTLEVVIAPLLEAVSNGEHALGVACPDVSALVRLVTARCVAARRDPARQPPTRSLDDYIEAQVHGPVRLGEDVEALVSDPSFRGTEIGDTLLAVAARYDVPLLWHAGYVLRFDRVPPDFRGPEVAALAARVAEWAREEALDAELIGRAARSVLRAPEQWTAFGPPGDALQLLKKLWHVLVWHGEPAHAFDG